MLNSAQTGTPHADMTSGATGGSLERWRGVEPTQRDYAQGPGNITHLPCVCKGVNLNETELQHLHMGMNITIFKTDVSQEGACEKSFVNSNMAYGDQFFFLKAMFI